MELNVNNIYLRTYNNMDCEMILIIIIIIIIIIILINCNWNVTWF